MRLTVSLIRFGEIGIYQAVLFSERVTTGPSTEQTSSLSRLPHHATLSYRQSPESSTTFRARSRSSGTRHTAKRSSELMWMAHVRHLSNSAHGLLGGRDKTQ